MSKLRIYKRDWLNNQTDVKLFDICKNRNINISKYFTKVGNKYLANKKSKINLIDEIISTNPDYKDRIQTIARIVAVIVAILGLLFGIYKFFIENEEEVDKSNPPPTLVKTTAGNKLYMAGGFLAV